MGKSYGKGFNDGLKAAENTNLIKTFWTAVVAFGLGLLTATMNKNKK